MKTSFYLLAVIIFLASCQTSLPYYSDTENYKYPEYNLQTTLVLGIEDYNETDCTEIIQSALDSEYATIVFTKQAGPWNTLPLFLRRDNVTLIFEPGSILQAKRGEYHERGDSLLTLEETDNINIIGYGATLRMWRSDYDKAPYEHGEWRSGIVLRGCNYVKIEGLTITETGGDGIYIGKMNRNQTQHNCTNIIVKNLYLTHNYRQGISVISAIDLLIENCVIYGTKGTAPQAGIDFEPNKQYQELVNCIVRNCIIQKNRGPGIEVYLIKYDSESIPINITIENCISNRNGWGIGVFLGGLKHKPTGTLTLLNNELGCINFLPDKSITVIRVDS